MLGALAALATAIVVGARALYPHVVERRAAARREIGPDGIVVGATPIDLPRPGAPGVLLLHGAGDTPQVVRGLAEFLGARGYSVRAPLLSGHGRTLREFGAVTSAAWHEDARREYDRMLESHEEVGIVGLSMGGALAIALAAERGHDIPALVLLAPYIAMPALVRRAAMTSAWWGPLWPYFSSRGERSVHDPEAAARGLGYGVFTPAALRALHEVVADAERALHAVVTPTLVIQSREDNRIPAEDAERAFRTLGAREKQFVWVQGAAHVITVDFGRERVFELTASWLDRRLRPRRPRLASEGSTRRG
jgi:carboxylesterase